MLGGCHRGAGRCGLRGGYGELRRGELGEEGREGFWSERLTVAIEVVDAHVAEVLDVGTELLCRGVHESIVKAGGRTAIPPIA